jgi:hypothetical protein
MNPRLWRSSLTVACVTLSAALAVAAVPIAVKDVKVTEKTSSVGATKGNKYLTVQFTTTVNEEVPKLMTVKVKSTCKAGDKTVEAENGGLGAGIDKVAKGASKDVSVPLYMSTGLPAKPQSCEFSFTYGKLTSKTGDAVADFCWDGGATAKEGHCK